MDEALNTGGTGLSAAKPPGGASKKIDEMKVVGALRESS
jgi:hypothetical protein